MINMIRTTLMVIVVIASIRPVVSIPQEVDLRGQLSGWAVTNPDRATQLGLRYIPDLIVNSYWKDYTIDADLSLKMYGSVQFEHKQDTIYTFDEFEAYRTWLRFSASQFEIRAGLQKIEFGPALLLRALMWFASIDPRDPLQIIEGVWGVSTRYFFLNNTNIWFWVLYGNDQIRGWELFASDKDYPELGGRFQFPLFTGELALTYHHRQIMKNSGPSGYVTSEKPTVPENRFGLDGKWDVEVGIWGELVLIHRNLESERYNYQRQTNVGVDYTFPWGNGLYAIAEYFTFSVADEAFAAGENTSLIATSLDYPFGIFDDVRAIVYYELENQNWYRFIQWQRTYDNWNVFLMGFWNPETYQLFPGASQNNVYAGKGVQLLLVFNH